MVVGAGADKAAGALFTMLQSHTELSGRIKAALRVAKRRWNLRLRNGVEILLPENGAPGALAYLMKLHKRYELLSGNINKIDMRISDRITLRRA